MSNIVSLDKHLVDRLQQGDESSFKEIYQANWKNLFNIAYQKTRDQEAAEEIVQNIFVDLWLNRETRKIDNLKAYLATSVRYKVINYIKNQLVREKYLSVKSVEGEEPESIESIYNLKELNKQIESCLAQLPPKTQQIFRLSRFELKSNKEIAESHNISEKAVEYHITQSLKSLRTFLKDYALIIFYFFYNLF
ncbi:RNA polymerase sigma-70 factor [Pseudopedobacter beijingensis]|uniref:RNA polymerase sigma-70 factor n=1 Tax=Pseudopedobacter beijingensis TaxID=1207056 RepID=A0ABW4ID12_9SPHI